MKPDPAPPRKKARIMAGMDAQAVLRIDATRCCDGSTAPQDGRTMARGAPGEIHDVFAAAFGVERGVLADPVTGQAAGYVQ